MSSLDLPPHAITQILRVMGVPLNERRHLPSAPPVRAKTTPTITKDWLTRDEAATRFRLGRKLLDAGIQKGVIGVTGPRRAPLYSRKDLWRWSISVGRKGLQQ